VCVEVWGVHDRSMHVDDCSLDFVTPTEGKWTTANGSSSTRVFLVYFRG